MVLSWFYSEKNESKGVVLAGFVRRVAEGMSCFFGCFRVRDSHLVPAPKPVVSSSRNALSSLFLCDDESVGKRDKHPEELDFRELKDEAKFLKACGTLPETPVEIRKGSEKWDNPSSKFNMEKLDESPRHVKISEDSTIGAGSLYETPSSCMTDGENARRGSISSILSSDMKNVITSADVCDSETCSATSSVSPAVFAPSVQGRNKSVHFVSEFDGSAFSSKGSSSEGTSQGLKLSGSSGSSSVSKQSQTSTPLKLTDEMQTPGTEFPACMSNVTVGKPTRIRSQYVYSVLNPVDNNSGWKELNAVILDSDHQKESPNLNDEAILTSTMAIKDVSEGKKIECEASSSTEQCSNNKQFGSIFGENIVYGRTPGDRPILGMVAAHWKDDESSHISPTMWDGNGIPNSTNKYKEDQKVSWHATPFEERLEKALSEGTFASQRKAVIGTAVVELDETETALSHLQSPAHLKSVVSF